MDRHTNRSHILPTPHHTTHRLTHTRYPFVPSSSCVAHTLPLKLAPPPLPQPPPPPARWDSARLPCSQLHLSQRSPRRIRIPRVSQFSSVLSSRRSSCWRGGIVADVSRLALECTDMAADYRSPYGSSSGSTIGRILLLLCCLPLAHAFYIPGELHHVPCLAVYPLTSRRLVHQVLSRW